jgi:hypothetical protein
VDEFIWLARLLCADSPACALTGEFRRPGERTRATGKERIGKDVPPHNQYATRGADKATNDLLDFLELSLRRLSSEMGQCKTGEPSSSVGGAKTLT